ncbi:MAG: ATP-binding protein [Chloroflexota bacterium]
MAFDQTIFQQIVETMNEGLLVVDTASVVLFANSAAANCLGQSVQSLLDKRCPLSFVANQTIEREMKGSQGKTAVLQIKATGIDWHDQPATLLTVSDITEQRRMAEYTRHVTLLSDITRAAMNNLGQHDLLQMLADRLGELHRADGCFLTLWDEAQQTAVLGAAYGPLKHLYPQLFANNTLRRLLGHEQKPIAIHDIRKSRFFSKKRIQKLPVHSMLLLPLTLHEQHIGTVVLLFVRAVQFSDEMLVQIQQAAEQVTLVLAKERLMDETKVRSQDLEALATVSIDLRASRRVAEMLPLILQTADLANETMSCIFWLDAEKERLNVTGCYPQAATPMPESVPNIGILHHVLENQRPYLTEHLADDPLATDFLLAIGPFRATYSNIFLPLQAEGRNGVGVLQVGLLTERDFSDREIRLLTAVTEIAVSAFQRTLLLQTLEERVQERTQELADANQKLRQLDRLRAKFVTDMSHELRTPVTTFQLYLDLIERAPPDKQDRYFSILRTQTERLARLIEKALTLSRVDITADSPVFDLVDFHEIVETAVSTYVPSAEGKAIQLHLVSEASLPYLHGSQSHLRMMVGEILDNAIQYNLAGGDIWVAVALDKTEQHLSLLVEDSGRGVAEREIPHLFDRFYRGEDIAQLGVPGTGLGLSIVKEVVALHEGTIVIRPRDGGGTAVFVSLPLQQERVAEAALQQD